MELDEDAMGVRRQVVEPEPRQQNVELAGQLVEVVSDTLRREPSPRSSDSASIFGSVSPSSRRRAAVSRIAALSTSSSACRWLYTSGTNRRSFAP